MGLVSGQKNGQGRPLSASRWRGDTMGSLGCHEIASSQGDIAAVCTTAIPNVRALFN